MQFAHTEHVRGALGVTTLPDVRPDPALDRLTHLAARLTGAPTALVTLLDTGRHVVASAHGASAHGASAHGPLSDLLGQRELPRSHRVHGLCTAVLASGAPLVLADVRADVRFAGDEAVGRGKGAPDVVAYLGVPLAGEAGHLVGTLSVVDIVPRVWEAETVAALRELAALGAPALVSHQQGAERSQADAQLRASEAQYRHLVESLPLIVYIVEPDAPYAPRYVSPAVEMLGYPRHAWLEQPDLWMRVLHPDDRERVLGATEAAREANATVEYEYRVLAPDGAVRWVHDRGWFVRDASGRAVAWQGVMLDVTARKAAEEARSESEARFQGLVESAHEGVWAVDSFARTTYVNARMAVMLGYPVDALLGRELLDFMDATTAREAQSRLDRRRQGASESYELALRRSDGSALWVQVSASPLRAADGTFTGALALISDLTERRRAEAALRESEARLRLALDVAGLTIWEHDLRDDRLSPDAPTPDGVAGYLTAVHVDDRERVARASLDALANGGEFTAEFRTTAVDGSLRWQHAMGRVLRGADGCPERLLGVSLDVTERVTLEGQLRQAQKMEAVGQLAGGIAHDFNNLLTVITASTRFALEALPPGAVVREDLAAVDEAAGRAAQLTGQLLAFSRQQLLRPEVLDLNAVVRGIEPMLRRLIGEDIVVLTLLAPALAPVLADPGQLEQVLMNLAVNARDAMPQGGRLVIETATVEVTPAEAARRGGAVAPGAYLRLRVRDTGVGMDEATLARVFEPFFTTKEPGKGTGLGLATVYGIVQQSGGSVWVSSAPGQGTTFEVDLPQAVAAEVPDAASAGDAPAVAPGSETVLLVEDEAAVRAIVRRILRQQGYTVLEASHGREGLRVAERHVGRIDLVVTDVVMPELSGRAFAEQLASTHPGVRVLFMSGYTDDEILRRGFFLPGMALLEKPFTADGLLQAVREVLDGRR